MFQRRARPIRRMDIEELRRARNRELVFHPTREEKIEIVGQKEAARREVGEGGAGRDGFLELQRGIVEDVGDAGGGVDTIEGRAGVGEALEAGLRAGITVGVDGEDETAGVVDEREASMAATSPSWSSLDWDAVGDCAIMRYRIRHTVRARIFIQDMCVCAYHTQ